MHRETREIAREPKDILDNMNAQLEPDLAKGSIDIAKDLVSIGADYDLARFTDAVAATPGCKAPWDEGGPSGTF